MDCSNSLYRTRPSDVSEDHVRNHLNDQSLTLPSRALARKDQRVASHIHHPNSIFNKLGVTLSVTAFQLTHLPAFGQGRAGRSVQPPRSSRQTVRPALAGRLLNDSSAYRIAQPLPSNRLTSGNRRGAVLSSAPPPRQLHTRCPPEGSPAGPAPSWLSKPPIPALPDRNPARHRR